MYEINQRFKIDYSYPICFTRGLFDADNPVLRNIVLRGGSPPHRLLPVIDADVLRGNPQLPVQLQRYAGCSGGIIELVAEPLIVRGGEICKSDPREIDEFHALVQRHGVCRHSYVLVIGGGSVIDAVGYAAATAHRGIRLIRVPTTVLGQNDAGIGVKNAINYLGRKNYLGTFAPPFAVINDFNFLRTLAPRERRAGMAEAVKVALIKDREFFDWLYKQRYRLAAFEDNVVEAMVTRCAELHLQHIRSSGDPFEQGSARPLDFGHWSAHRLEELSNGELRHGEAVAIGIALDSTYSHAAGMIGAGDLHRILATLTDLGFGLYHPALRKLDAAHAMEEFREHLGGRLCITLLAAIGWGTEVHEIDQRLMARSINGMCEQYDVVNLLQ